MSSEHKATYSAVIIQGEKKLGVATLKHLANDHYLLKISYELPYDRRQLTLHIDEKRVLYDAESSDGDPKNQKELVRFSRMARVPLSMLSRSPDGNSPDFLRFAADLEAKLTNSDEHVDFHHTMKKGISFAAE
jgi:hypothetical protein